jgi:ligand-binding sensor domain-containing protein
MRISFFLLFFSGMMTFSLPGLYAQHPEWVNYTHNKNTAQALAVQGNTVWVGTLGGVVKVDRQTGQRTFLDKSNTGLPGLSIYAVAADANGNVWFGDSEVGLTHFDGIHWVHYHTGNSGLPHNKVNDIAVDPAGIVWVATQGGLARFDGTGWTVWGDYGSVERVMPENDTVVWFGAQHHGLIRLSDTVATKFHPGNSPLPAVFIMDLNLQYNGTLWVATTGGLVSIIDTTWTVYTTANSPLPHNLIRCVGTDTAGNVWIGCQTAGVVVKSGNTWTVYNQANAPLPCNFTIDMVVDESGLAWIAACTGFGSFNRTHWTAYPTANSNLPYGAVHAIGQDTTGRFLFGTASGGVDFNGTVWSDLQGLPHHIVNAIVCDTAGEMWVGTDGGITVYHAGGGWTSYTSATSPLPVASVRDIAFGVNGMAWFAGDQGAVSFDGSQWTHYSTTNSQIAGNDLLSVLVDNNGAVWFGTASEGIARFSNPGWTTFPPAAYGMGGTSVKTLWQDTTGNIWAGSHGGLSVYDGNAWTNYNTGNSGLPSNVVTAITGDPNGFLWIGTIAGLVRYDGANWTLFNMMNSGLASNFIETLFLDDNQRLWVGTYTGGVAVYNEGKVVKPFIYTTGVQLVTHHSAEVSAIITHNGGDTTLSRGIVWDTIPNPTTGNAPGHLSAGTGAGAFSGTLTPLQEQQTYYARPYATNAAGTSYGEEVTFTTLISGIATLKQTAEILLYPVPCRDHLNINTPKPTAAITLFDLTGRVVIQQSFKGSTQITMDMSNINPGIYLLKITYIEGKTVSLRVVKGR